MNAVHQPLPSPDRGCLVALIQPLLRGDDVHTPQAPVVAVGSVGVLLHLKGVVFDVVYGRKDDAGVILFHPGQNRFRPLERERKKKTRCSELHKQKQNCSVEEGVEDRSNLSLGKNLSHVYFKPLGFFGVLAAKFVQTGLTNIKNKISFSLESKIC